MGGNTSSGEDVLNRLVGPVRKPGPTRRGKGPVAKAASRGKKAPARKPAAKPVRRKKRG